MRELYLHKEKECSQLKQKLMLLKKELDEKVNFDDTFHHH